MLTTERINHLANGKNVRRIAVESFLGTLSGLNRRQAEANLAMDAKLYRWNRETVSAIQEGIVERFKN
jgi:hypothetical protein